MSRAYTPIALSAVKSFLTPRGFYASSSGHEATYVGRLSAMPHVAVVVYTACTVGDDISRANGDDAIRVTVKVHAGRDASGKVRVAQIHGTTRIHRVGGESAILGRIEERIGEAKDWAMANLSPHPCARCGAAKYKSGMCVSRDCRTYATATARIARDDLEE